MSAAKHTPGPWRFDPDGDFIWSVPSGAESPDVIADVRGYGANLPREANGQLLAAAPELLEAAKAAVQELCGLAAYLETCDHAVILDNLQSLVAGMRHKQELIEAAIRKARGER